MTTGEPDGAWLQLARVMRVDADGLVVYGGGRRTARVPWPNGVQRAIRTGDLVRVTADAVEVVTRPRLDAAFPQQDGDFAWFAADDGLRFRMVEARAVLLRAVRQFFHTRGFLEVDTPAIATSPGLELHLDAVQVRLREGMGGAPVKRWLVTSPEYHCKRLLSAGFTRIFSLGKAFRSGERGGHHNPEFTMLEWYRADADYRDIVRDVRALVRFVAEAVQRACPPDPAPGVHPLEPRAPWQTLTVRAAVRKYAGFDIGHGDDDALVRQRALETKLDVRPTDTAADVVMRALVERVEPLLLSAPGTILTEWPLAMASLARVSPERPHVAERFEVYLLGVEIANGFSELTDAVEQRARLVSDQRARWRTRKPVYPLDERFLAALAEGLPPSAGVALGIDRLLLVVTGRANLDEVLAFPFERA